MNAPACSLIVSIYNQSRQLALLLETAVHQTCTDFEIIVADDGSRDDVASVVDRFRCTHWHIPVHVLGHDDRGFRKSCMLNQACRNATDYCVVVDGDMLLGRRFIENHLRYRDPRRVLCGYRGVKLGPAYTQALLEHSVPFRDGLMEMLRRKRRGELDSSPWRATELHNPILRRLAVPARKGLSGCNFSVYRDALKQVNGWDESILEYGYEDYELGHRLKLSGLSIVNVSKCCNTYHLYHAKGPKRDLGEIKRRIDASPHPQCHYGIAELASGSSNADFQPVGMNTETG